MNRPGPGRELLLSVTIADCTVQTYRGSGAGGQNRNKRDTGVRIIHPPSGARAECCEERSQHQNKVRAFRRLAETPAMRAWLAGKAAEAGQRSADLRATIRRELADPAVTRVEYGSNDA